MQTVQEEDELNDYIESQPNQRSQFKDRRSELIREAELIRQG